MDKKHLNDLLKWSVENSTKHEDNTGPGDAYTPNAEALAALFGGGPSDADLMKAAVEHITSTDPEVTRESRLTAFDNLEQLIEGLDNANLLAKLGLWTPLLEQLANDDAAMRRMAAWVVGTAVQNNAPCQERLTALGGVEKLTALALGERLPGSGSTSTDTTEEKKEPTDVEKKEEKDARKKAIYALSSAVRNYQPAMDVLSRELDKRDGKKSEQVEASNMDAVDTVINSLREKAANT
jgi:hsp70-interacting protein